MTRYQAMRKMEFDPLVAAFICVLNWLAGVPQGTVVILHTAIDYED